MSAHLPVLKRFGVEDERLALPVVVLAARVVLVVHVAIRHRARAFRHGIFRPDPMDSRCDRPLSIGRLLPSLSPDLVPDRHLPGDSVGQHPEGEFRVGYSTGEPLDFVLDWKREVQLIDVESVTITVNEPEGNSHLGPTKQSCRLR